MLETRSMILGLDFEDSLEGWKGANEPSGSTLKIASCFQREAVLRRASASLWFASRLHDYSASASGRTAAHGTQNGGARPEIDGLRLDDVAAKTSEKRRRAAPSARTTRPPQ